MYVQVHCMPSIAQKKRTERLNVRATDAQARLIRLAARETHANVSNFLVESGCLPDVAVRILAPLDEEGPA